MPSRQTLPTMWLISDERIGDALWDAIERVPRGGGVVLRHHRSNLGLGRGIADNCARRGLLLAVAGDVGFARAIGAAMVHNPVGQAEGLLVSRSVHDLGEAQAALGADLAFVSPLFATASHPGATPIGIAGAVALARHAEVPGIALGGMDAARGEMAIAAGLHGWAAIDAWIRRPA